MKRGDGGMTNRRNILLIIVIFFVSALAYCWLHFATDHTVLRQLHKLPQNTRAYLNPSQQTVSLRDQEKLTNRFITHYFAPWQHRVSPSEIDHIKNDLKFQLKKFEKKPGVGANTHVYTANWIKNIEYNTDLAHFPNYSQDAITIRDSSIRILPTTDPSFTDMTSVSKGYPFDNLQQTFIPAGTPIHIIQESKDKGWYLVIASSFSGWINDEDIAFASDKFKSDWQTDDYAVSTQDNIPIFDEKRRLITKTRIGVLYPISKASKKDFTILSPTKNTAGDAMTKPVVVSRAFLTEFPVPISTQNIAAIANNLMGKPYGWGGIYGYRDCSATTKDIMASFGIWLPRNSAMQIQAGQNISLAGLKNAEKEKTILKNGIPFLTLINLPGHVVLYIGQKEGHPIVFQNLWGVHIYKFFCQKDRIVIGQTVITSLNFGSNFINASSNHLTEATSMTLLVDRSAIK